MKKVRGRQEQSTENSFQRLHPHTYWSLCTSSCSHFPRSWVQVTRFSEISRCESVCSLETVSFFSTLDSIYFKSKNITVFIFLQVIFLFFQHFLLKIKRTKSPEAQNEITGSFSFILSQFERLASLHGQSPLGSELGTTHSSLSTNLCKVRNPSDTKKFPADFSSSPPMPTSLCHFLPLPPITSSLWASVSSSVK